MGQLKVDSIQIRKEGFCIEVVGPIALDCSAVLQQRKLRKIHVLAGQAHKCGQAVIVLPLDGSAHHVEIRPSVQVAQHSTGMRLEVECAADRNILAGECPYVSEGG